MASDNIYNDVVGLAASKHYELGGCVAVVNAVAVVVAVVATVVVAVVLAVVLGCVGNVDIVGSAALKHY